MIFITDSQTRQLHLQKNLLRETNSDGTFIDAWLTEEAILETTLRHNVQLQVSSNGIFGTTVCHNNDLSLQERVEHLYADIFNALSLYKEYTLLRIWNYLPDLLPSVEPGENNYTAFNAGRHQAFAKFLPSEFLAGEFPVASAVGHAAANIKIEFLAVKGAVRLLENKDQVASCRYSDKYGKCPPLFSRGAIYKNLHQTILLSAGTASVVGEDSTHDGLYDQVNQSIYNLRILGSQFNLKQYNIQYGFALEDAVHMRVYYKKQEDEAFLRAYLRKIVSPGCTLSFMRADICRDELLVELEAIFVKKGEFEKKNSQKYILENKRIRTESFELHVAEHCNLRCRDCCNISPFNAHKFMSLEEVEDICKSMEKYIRPDLFKIAGGEPTLHPQLDELIRIVKSYNIAPQVRVVSNGLLMHRMSNDFWKQIDQLTISNYVSAPVKLQTLALIKEKCREYGIVLNIKNVEQFNEIFVEEAFADAGQVQSIYDDCWMRHRCHIVRNGYYYKCTRAAYMNEYLGILKKETSVHGSTYSELDGIALSDPQFQDNLLTFLNDKKPLHSCKYCLGVSGKLRENIQLSKKEIEQVLNK